MSNHICFVKLAVLFVLAIIGAAAGCGGGGSEGNCVVGPDGWCWWTFAHPSTTATWVTPPSTSSAHTSLTAEPASINVGNAGVGFSFAASGPSVDLSRFDRVVFTAIASTRFEFAVSSSDTAGCSMNFSSSGTKQTYTAEFSMCSPYNTDSTRPAFSPASVTSIHWDTVWGMASSLDIEIVPDILFCLGTQCTTNPLSPGSPGGGGTGGTGGNSVGEQSWSSVASSSDGANLVAVAIGGYIYTSSNSGATWTQTGHQDDWSSVASSSDGTRIVAATNQGYIYKSSDSGATWTQTGRQGTSVASSSDGTRIVVVERNGWISTSSDSGATWTGWPTGSPMQRQWTSVASSSDGTKLVAVDDDSYPDIYTSVDAGAVWTWPESQASFSGQTWTSVAVSSNGTMLVAAGIPYIYTSFDFGATWENSTSPAQAWTSVASSSDGTKLVAVCSEDPADEANSGYIFTSADSGATWTQTGPQENWTSVASSSDGAKLVAVADCIYTSSNYGATWTQRQCSGGSGPTSR